MGFTFNVGPECEFFLFQTDDEGYPTTTTIDHGSYFELGPVDRGEDARRDICLTLELSLIHIYLYGSKWDFAVFR